MNQTNRRALVTGSSGFIGSRLITRLVDAGWEVHLLERPRKEPSTVEVAGRHSYTGQTVQVMETLQSVQPSTVFHLASLFLATHKSEQIEDLISANVLLGTQLLEAMTASGATHLVNTGTSWQYFHSDEFRPVNLYAATKQAFEDIIAYYVDARSLRAVTLDLFDSYGPNDPRPKLLKLLMSCMQSGEALQMSGGEQMIDLAHVDDICDAFLRADELVHEPTQPSMTRYAVSGGEPHSLRDTVRILEKAAEKKLNVEWGARPYREREVMRLWQGPTLPGWKPKRTLDAGFRSLIEASHS